jgi:hypothetical protein
MTAGQGDQHGQQGQPEGQGGQQPSWPPAQEQQGQPGQPAHGQPQQGQPPYGQPQYGQPQYGQPQQGQSPYGQPQQGQPQYGQPPYGQPPYGQPPYGQPQQGQPQQGQSPYGQAPYGYAPAPTAPTGWGPDAPAPMERPVTVRAGIGAFLASLVLSAVATLAMVLNWDEFRDWALSDAGAELDDMETAGMDPEAFADLILQLSVAFGVIMLLLSLLFVWFAWKGRNWARIVLWVLGGITLVSAPFASASTGPLPFVNALTWFQIALTAVGVVLLALRPSNDWYSFRKWQRANGQG